MGLRNSHSRIEGFNRCPFKYKLRYLDRLKTIPNTDPDNALILGTALHTGIEEGIPQALDFYTNSFPIITDDHVHELIKLEALIPKAAALLPPGGAFEVPIGDEDFIGFIDYLAPLLVEGKQVVINGYEYYDLYDFKYSSNINSYLKSGQLHEYKYWYEKTHPGHRIRNLCFLFVPKVRIKQKKAESLQQFRDRLADALKAAEPTVVQVQFNPLKIVDFLTDTKHLIESTEFPRNPNHFCGWCEYEEFCQKGWDYMILPKNERRDLNATKKKVVWVYGAPFSGKTFFANSFPDPLMLNTDGNIKFVDAPYIAIRDTVTVEGRITKRQLAWEVFTDAVAELEKKQNDFKTVVVDLLEDVYEACRVYICDRQGWKHESDDSFRAWDMVRSEFLNTLKRLMNMDYENIVLISHEDRTRDLTRKGGDKISSIKPNLQDKVANKVAGMVDLVARIVADDNERVLSFKTSEVIFGGGRLTVRNKEIPLTYANFCEVYEEANAKAVKAAEKAADAPKAPAPTDAEKPVEGEQRPSRRGRRAKAEETPTPAENQAPDAGGVDVAKPEAPAETGTDDNPPWEGDDDPPAPEPPAENPPRRSRRSRSAEESTENPPHTAPDAADSTAASATPDPASLPKCPDAERIFKQWRDSNGEIPLCPNIDPAHRCHKYDDPAAECALLDRPKAGEGPAPDANPPRRTRKRRE